MEAIEFIAKIKDGTIKIPKKYLNKLSEEFRVIILINSESGVGELKKKPFAALSIKTKDFHFDRDESNQR